LCASTENIYRAGASDLPALVPLVFATLSAMNIERKEPTYLFTDKQVAESGFWIRARG
jgi:hypothetical protein